MKFLKFLLAIVSFIVIAAMVWMSTIDGKYDTSRSRVINTPADVIFNHVNDFKEWPKWDPWSEGFGDMEIIYSGDDKGVGSKYSWSGEESGEGNMEIITVIPYTSIDQVINFETPFESSSDIYWRFKKVDGGTEVTWGMKGEMGFFTRPMAAEMDNMMEKDLLRGLEKLDSISVLAANASSFKIEGLIDSKEIIYVGIESNDVPLESMEKLMAQNFPKVIKWIKYNNVDIVGAPFTLYKKWDEKTGLATFVSGIPIKSKVKKIKDKNIMQGTIEAQKCAKTVYMGDYSGSEEAWMTTFAYIEGKGLKHKNSNPFEVYVTGPSNETNPDKWITEIYIPVK